MDELPVMKLHHHIRIGAERTHYAGGMVSGGCTIELATDCVGELSYLQDGCASMLVRVDDVEILSSIYVGDALDVDVETTRVGNRSRDMSFRIQKTLARIDGVIHVCKEPILVCTGKCTVVTEKGGKA